MKTWETATVGKATNCKSLSYHLHYRSISVMTDPLERKRNMLPQKYLTRFLNTYMHSIRIYIQATMFIIIMYVYSIFFSIYKHYILFPPIIFYPMQILHYLHKIFLSPALSIISYFALFELFKRNLPPLSNIPKVISNNEKLLNSPAFEDAAVSPDSSKLFCNSR